MDRSDKGDIDQMCSVGVPPGKELGNHYKVMLKSECSRTWHCSYTWLHDSFMCEDVSVLLTFVSYPLLNYICRSLMKSHSLTLGRAAFTL